MVQPLWRTVWRFLKKLKIELSYDPAIPLLGIYLKKTKTLPQNYICTPLFSAALFTMDKIWKESKCPLMDKWIRKMWSWDVPGGPVSKTACFQCRGPGFDPWSGN